MIDEASWISENKERVAYFAGTSATDNLWPYIAARSPINQNNQFQPFHISLYLVFIYFLRNNRDSTNSKSLSFLTSLMQFREKCIKPCNSPAVACHPLLNFSMNNLPYALHAGQFQHMTTMHKLGHPVIKKITILLSFSLYC